MAYNSCWSGEKPCFAPFLSHSEVDWDKLKGKEEEVWRTSTLAGIWALDMFQVYLGFQFIPSSFCLQLLLDNLMHFSSPPIYFLWGHKVVDWSAAIGAHMPVLCTSPSPAPIPCHCLLIGKEVVKESKNEHLKQRVSCGVDRDCWSLPCFITSTSWC